MVVAVSRQRYIVIPHLGLLAYEIRCESGALPFNTSEEVRNNPRTESSVSSKRKPESRISFHVESNVRDNRI